MHAHAAYLRIRTYVRQGWLTNYLRSKEWEEDLHTFVTDTPLCCFFPNLFCWGLSVFVRDRFGGGSFLLLLNYHFRAERTSRARRSSFLTARDSIFAGDLEFMEHGPMICAAFSIFPPWLGTRLSIWRSRTFPGRHERLPAGTCCSFQCCSSCTYFSFRPLVCLFSSPTSISTTKGLVCRELR